MSKEGVFNGTFGEKSLPPVKVSNWLVAGASCNAFVAVDLSPKDSIQDVISAGSG